MKFIELVDVNGVQRLLPLDKLEIYFINSDISNDGSYWVVGSVGSKEISIHVPGPSENILKTLKGETVSGAKIEELKDKIKADMKYMEVQDKKYTNLKKDCYDLEVKTKDMALLESTLKETRLAYAKLEKINPTLGQWSNANIHKYSCPSFWSMYKIKKGYQQYPTNRLFATPIGSTGQGYSHGLNKSHTNIKERGRFGYMGENAKLDFWGVKVELFGAPEDIQLAKKVGTVSFDFTQTTIDIGNLGSFDWIENATGYYKFAEPKDPNFKFMSPVSNFSMFGRDVVTVKPSMEMGVLFNLNDEPTLKDDLEVRITLFGNYSVNVEIG